MSVHQVRALIESSTRLGPSDKQIPNYPTNIRMTQKLDAGAIEDLTGVAGPRTLEALRKLGEASRSMPAPPPPVVKPVAQPIPPPSREEQDKVLAAVREYALEYSKKLPNFIC